MCKPSKYINNVCPSCNPRNYGLSLAKFTGEEEVIGILGGREGEFFVEYLYECCRCGTEVWVDDQWAKDNAVEI